MSKLPRGWVEAPLKCLGELRYGKGLTTADLLPKGYPVFGANDLIGYYNQFHYEDEQILISRRGANSGAININPKECFVTNNSLILELSTCLASGKSFIRYALEQCDKSQVVTGSAQPQVTIANAEQLKIPVAPLSEQQVLWRK